MFDGKIRFGFISKIAQFFGRAKVLSKEKGIHYVVVTGTRITLSWIRDFIGHYFYIIFKSPRSFTFQGRSYDYFYHRYNATWRGERTVEVPIIWEIVKENADKTVLEVGNVLSRYYSVNHDIVDKYEKVDGVINQDIVDFQPTKKYNLIFSISTLEHVGWEEKDEPKDPLKILRAIDKLKEILATEGKIVVTLPLGYNPQMDKLLKDNRIQFNRKLCLKKIARDNQWQEVAWEDIQNSKYNDPFKAVNGVLIGIIEKT